MRQALGSFERAAARTYAAAPFHAVVSVRLEGALDAETIRGALSRVVGREPRLSAYVVDGRFEPSGIGEPELRVERRDDEDAEGAIDELLCDRPRERGAHPVRARLTQHARSATLSIGVPHYLVDATSLGQILFATLAGGARGPEGGATDLPAVESRFPPGYRGVRVVPKVARYLVSEMAGEARLRFGRPRGLSRATPPDGNTRHVVRSIEPAAAAKLSEGCRKHECTLLGLLAAAALRVSVGEPGGVLGLISFRDLRRRVEPAFSADEIGPCFSMVRHLVKVADGDDWRLAGHVSKIMAESGRRRDAFLANLVAPYLVGMAIPMRMRLGDVAVSFPVLSWPDEPFVSRVRSFSGFVSTLPFAPPISIVAARSPAGLALGFVYLDSEFDRNRADAMADAVAGRVAAAAGSLR
jgi:hypothetical protein